MQSKWKEAAPKREELSSGLHTPSRVEEVRLLAGAMESEGWSQESCDGRDPKTSFRYLGGGAGGVKSDVEILRLRNWKQARIMVLERTNRRVNRVPDRYVNVICSNT